jgi:hypothetical protein
MKNHLRTVWITFMTCAVVGLTVPAAAAGGDSPPNWKASGTGTTRPEGGVDVDTFRGGSAHLGRFTGEGFHVLNPVTFTFTGQATWTASNGDTLRVTYAGQVFLTGDPVYPFGFTADLVAAGGTGRLAFTGVPGDFFFSVEGTLHPNGR